MNETFEETYIGKVMEQILIFHQDKEILYKFDDEGDEVFEEICDKLNGLFNMKYSTGSQISSSQTPLDTAGKAEINVRTKATELIGRLACILWVYCKGIKFHTIPKSYSSQVFLLINSKLLIIKVHVNFVACECVQEAKPFNIPNVVKGEYVRKAEEVVNTSYNQSEMFTSVRYDTSVRFNIIKCTTFMTISI